MTATEIVRSFWTAMGSNDYRQVAETWLAPDFIALWPQTGEVIRGRDAFAAVNAGFPGQGDWRFEEVSLIAEGERVVTDMRITNAPLAMTARALTWHETAGGLICRQTEFWPDPYPVPDWRAGLLPQDSDLARW